MNLIFGVLSYPVKGAGGSKYGFRPPPPTLTEDFIQKKAAAGEKILVPFFEKFDGFSKNFENLTVS